MTDEQARFLAAPFGDVLVVYKAPATAIKGEPIDGKLDRDKRGDGQTAKRLGARRTVGSKDTDDADRQSGDEA
jgi:hypothetical protein